MGAVKVDFITKQKFFMDMSYSSKEDIYKILWMIDLIETEKDKFNHEALAVYVDFMGLIKSKKYINTYVNIRLGNFDYRDGINYSNVLSAIAEYYGVAQTDVEVELNREIDEIVQDNKERWLESVLNNVMYKYPNETRNDWYFPDENYAKIDYARKYIGTSLKHPEIEYPENLQSLIDAQKANAEKLKELKSKKHRNKEDRNELNIRIRYDKSLYDDINQLKKLYGYENNADEGMTLGGYSFNEDQDFYSDIENEGSIIDEWQLQQIKEVAENILTPKQLVIFHLYYENEFTQQEISDIIQIAKQDISRTIKTLNAKIKANL